jgi:hypothetical protein
MVLPDMREIVMTHAGHGIWKCSCGQVVKQCRCPDKNKPVHIVQNGCDACHTMTTPTTGTAPLIERLVAALRARYGHTKTGRPDLVASAWRDDAYAILEALGDGIWIEREQARKDISDLMMEDLFEARFEDYLDDKDAFRKRCDDYADAIIKAVEERP